jgi:hypothetical protein
MNKRKEIEMAKTISLKFDGYWREQSRGGIPSKSGIYVVYEGTYKPQSDTVSLQKIIYIGEAEDVNERIKEHEKWQDWKKHCGPRNELCFSFAYINNPNRERGEAALIYKHKPPVNDEYKYNFPFEETTMDLSGKTALLNTDFTVYPT